MAFFLFLLRVIRSFNRELKKTRYLGCLKAKKRLIEDQTFVEGGKVDLRKNQQLLSEIAKVEEDEALRGVKTFANEQGFRFEDAENLEALKDSTFNSHQGMEKTAKRALISLMVLILIQTALIMQKIFHLPIAK